MFTTEDNCMQPYLEKLIYGNPFTLELQYSESPFLRWNSDGVYDTLANIRVEIKSGMSVLASFLWKKDNQETGHIDWLPDEHKLIVKATPKDWQRESINNTANIVISFQTSEWGDSWVDSEEDEVVTVGLIKR